MFGHSYFGAGFYGPSFFGPAGLSAIFNAIARHVGVCAIASHVATCSLPAAP